ncbi:LEA type 2 family protein [Geomonas sp. Red69]|uniref:LEA type 2 family protein n=1 Tax=Geomonas diazotrophica TaxID=2843197 RepID=UPI001C0FA762|nr:MULTISPECIES: LEA type 2 family protein [Geomonas]MBU5636848.1 LEA type 2 family protein [Geomonas diazotrophica]QXE87526.1 LEA type 2 family protein [Geomonas nitrogeniifigens]
MRKIACLLLLVVLLSGCSKLVNAPLVTVQDLNVVSVDPTGAGMELYLSVQNTNSFDVKLQGYSYDIRIMALPLAKGGAREEINFPANEETDVRIPIRITYSDLLEIFKRRPDPDKIPYQLAAGLDLETPVGQMTIPVKKSGTYAIPKKYRPAAIFGKLADFLKF